MIILKHINNEKQMAPVHIFNFIAKFAFDVSFSYVTVDILSSFHCVEYISITFESPDIVSHRPHGSGLVYCVIKC